jgi:membrane protein DedA with SNARE-associated domain
VTNFFVHHGLPLLFLAVMLESFGIPVPGETALIAFGLLAAQGHYSIVLVIFLAAAGAIIGDNLGYWVLGRLGGRELFNRWGWLRRYSDRVLPRVERIFARHGGKTVFFGRFIAVLRVGVAAFYGGKAVTNALETYGLYAALAIVVVLAVGWFAVRRVKHRVEDSL